MTPHSEDPKPDDAPTRGADFRRSVDEFAEQAQEALRRGVARAGSLAHERADDIADALDKTGAKVDQRTEGRYAEQIAKVKATVNRGVATLAEQRDTHPDAQPDAEPEPTVIRTVIPSALPTTRLPVADSPDLLGSARWPRRTERLTIRPATVDDATATFAYRRLPEVSHYLPRHHADRAAYTEAFVLPERLRHTLVIERADEVVGDLMLRVGDGWAQSEVLEQARAVEAEIGWSLAPWAQGLGYAREAVADLLRLAFADLALRRVTALCFADNVPSWRLMERLGMRREVTARADSLHRSGVWLDTVGYALLREEWRDPADDLTPPAGSITTPPAGSAGTSN